MGDTRPKMKFNVIDFIIIVAILAIAAAVIMRGNIAKSFLQKASDEVIEYTIKIENIQKESDGFINIGDSVYSLVDGSNIGTITAKEPPEPTDSYVSLADGSIIKAVNPDRINLILTIQCPGRHTEEGFMLNGNAFVAAGKQINARTKNVTFSFQVENVTFASAE